MVAKFIDLLTAQERRRGVFLLGMAAIMALFETLGVASIMPFLAVLSDPTLVDSNAQLATIYGYLGRPPKSEFLVQLGAVSFMVVLVSASFRIVTNYFLNEYTEMMRHSLSHRLLDTYLRQPYEFFTRNNSSDLAKSILSEVDQVTQNFIRPLIQLVSYSVVGLCILAFLFSLNFKVAISALVVIGGSYAGIFLSVKRVLTRVGRERLAANRERYSAASEALGGIKAIKLLGREDAYLSRFRTPSIRQSKTQAINTTIAQLPKFLIEAIGFGGVVALALVLLIMNGGTSPASLGQVLPMLGAYAFAGLRLLPAAQNIYGSVANMRFGVAAVDEVHADILCRRRLAENPKAIAPKIALTNLITLDNISYRYPEAARNALADVSLAIPKGSKIGLVGGTGSGKTTLVDILLGLLQPSSGHVLVDGVPISAENCQEWQKILGYVQQDAFLADGSFINNIALGVPPNEIDQAHAIRCAKLAALDALVTDGMHTLVGERGIRLSGGERQRIGIARALYREPKVLILDEATSALDSQTEQVVMEGIYNFGHSITAVIIAHRLSTIRGCDRIYMLEEGRICAQGKYEELMETSPQFRRLAQHVQ
ncbi:ABC transporter ATP-binding protein [Sphingomonas sp. Root710]|nr:ABC transporter ATP-binding protein [Sphingomonas sp. Root710]